MKKLLIAFSMIGAGALIACATDNGTPTTETNDWFEVTTTNPTKDGSFNVPEGSSWINNGEKFEVESDLDNLDTLVSFTPGTQLTEKMAQVSFTLDAAIMPDALPDLDGKAKLAFAINQSGFNAWNGTDWVPLTGPDVPVEGTSFMLLVEFDNREASEQKVRFSVGGTPLKNASGADWISYSTAITAEVKVGFAGSGMITSFEGDQIKVTAEIIPVGGGTITIKEEDLEKFKAPEGSTYTTRDQFIAAPAKEAFGSSFATENITVGEAYALGLVADNGTGTMMPVNGGVLKAKAIAQSGSSDGVKLDLEVNPPEGTGATITYNILKDNAEYKKDLSKDQLIIPTKDLGVGLKVFKIQAIVTPAK